MKINILDIHKFIKDHNCPEVKNAILFNFGSVPTEDGLLSQELFGMVGSDTRKETFGYMNLNRIFLHPITYKILTSMNRKLADCIAGTKYFSINAKGEIVEDNEKGETGIDFLYDNWEKIKWIRTGSSARDDKLIVLEKTPKNLLFIDRFLIIPPYLRDFKPTEKNDKVDAVDEINDMYSKIIRLSQGNDGIGLSFMMNNTNFLIQNLLVDIYTYCTSQLASKTGLIHQALLGKTVDYATRSVISSPLVYSKDWQHTQVKFGYTGVPLSQIITLFYPFYIYEITTWFEQNLDSIESQLKEKNIIVRNFMEQFDEEHIKKLMHSYIKNKESRFKPITFKDVNGVEHKLSIYEDDLKRAFTPTDLFYIVGEESIAPKFHVYVTRYPVTNFQNIYPSRIKILTTQKTKPQKIGSKYFEEYPLILEESPDLADIENQFVDTVRLNAFFEPALNADHDGDTVSLRGVFTQESNDEAEKIINSPKYVLDSGGKTSRVLKNEAIQALYSLTY